MLETCIMDEVAQRRFSCMAPDERLALAKRTAEVLLLDEEQPVDINKAAKDLGNHYLLNNRRIGDLTLYLRGIKSGMNPPTRTIHEDDKKTLTTACHVLFLLGRAPEYDKIPTQMLVNTVAAHYRVANSISDNAMYHALERGRKIRSYHPRL